MQDWVNGHLPSELGTEKETGIVRWLVELELKVLIELPYRNVHQVIGAMDWTVRFGGHQPVGLNQNHEKE